MADHVDLEEQKMVCYNIFFAFCIVFIGRQDMGTDGFIFCAMHDRDRNGSF